jgi:hypothetical protein
LAKAGFVNARRLRREGTVLEPFRTPGCAYLSSQNRRLQSVPTSKQAEDKAMNPLTEHPRQQGVTYVEHWIFAMAIAWRLLTSAFAFALHAIAPFVSIEPRLDLEATSAYLDERNHFIETAAARAGARKPPVGRAPKPDRPDTPVPA